MSLPKAKLIEFGEKTSSGRKVDFGLIKEIYSHIIEEDKKFFQGETNEKNFKQTLKDGRTWFIIENENGEIIGVTSIHFNKFKHSNSLVRMIHDWRGWIGRTFILPKFRGQEFSGASKNELEKKAREKGLTELKTVIYHNNKKSRKAAEKIGFKINRWSELKAIPLNLRKMFYFKKKKIGFLKISYPVLSKTELKNGFWRFYHKKIK